MVDVPARVESAGCGQLKTTRKERSTHAVALQVLLYQSGIQSAVERAYVVEEAVEGVYPAG